MNKFTLRLCLIIICIGITNPAFAYTYEACSQAKLIGAWQRMAVTLHKDFMKSMFSNSEKQILKFNANGTFRDIKSNKPIKKQDIGLMDIIPATNPYTIDGSGELILTYPEFKFAYKSRCILVTGGVSSGLAEGDMILSVMSVEDGQNVADLFFRKVQ